MNIAAATSAASQSAAQNAQNKLTGDLESFLTLLTTQLKHQDPLEPVDSTEFTAQLAQFAAVEQGIAMNANLEKLIGLNNASQAASAVSYLGKYVEAKGDHAALVTGKLEFAYSLPQSSQATAIQIINEAGVPVKVLEGQTGIGKHSLVWDGTDSQGLKLPDGKYEIVIGAVDEKGQQIQSQGFTVGIVDGADNSGDKVNITINGIAVPLADVVTVKDPPSGA